MIRRRIQKHLELEALYTKIFEQVGFCEEFCISGDLDDDKKDYGCCGDFVGLAMGPRFLTKVREVKYPAITELKKKREIGPCRLHTEEGCAAKTHKPAICITYCCDLLYFYLGDVYGVDTRTLRNIRFPIHDLSVNILRETDIENAKDVLTEIVEKTAQPVEKPTLAEFIERFRSR